MSIDKVTQLRVTTSPEDQHKIALPLNRETETLYYNQRLILDAKVNTEPRAWEVSKIERTMPFGIVRLTLYQDRFNEHTDYIERDEDGVIIGMWADYFEQNTSDPTEHEENDNYTAGIAYSGTTSELKVGGSYKTFTMTYYDSEGNPISRKAYDWKFLLDGVEIPPETISVEMPGDSSNLDENQIKVKFVGSEDYYGSVLQIYNDDCFINVDIVGF